MTTAGAWDGRGLPPVARARLARAARGAVRTSLLPAGGLAGLEAAGFEVTGEVLGAAVMQVGWSGLLSSSSFGRYAQAVRHGRDAALRRMGQEAAALGADGVVGVLLTEESAEGGRREFAALGTAVRSRGRVRPAVLFTTDLGGQDLAKLLAAGWVPTGMAYGISVAVRSDDWRTRAQAGVFPFAGSVEVTGYTEVLRRARAGARDDFAAAAARLGGDAALLSGLTSAVRRVEAGQGRAYHVAECAMTGNAIARFHPGSRATTSSLTILPLRSTP